MIRRNNTSGIGDRCGAFSVTHGNSGDAAVILICKEERNQSHCLYSFIYLRIQEGERQRAPQTGRTSKYADLLISLCMCEPTYYLSSFTHINQLAESSIHLRSAVLYELVTINNVAQFSPTNCINNCRIRSFWGRWYSSRHENICRTQCLQTFMAQTKHRSME
jgi:hypothetical protein